MIEEIRPGSLGRLHARKRPRLPQDEPTVIMAIDPSAPGDAKGTLVNVIDLSVNPRCLCTCGRFLRDQTYAIHRCAHVVMAKKPQITAIYNNDKINITLELHAHVNGASILLTRC